MCLFFLGKHDGTSAFTHNADLTNIIENKTIEEYTHTRKGKVKPVLICISDGATDCGPKNAGVKHNMVKLFKKFNFSGNT